MLQVNKMPEYTFDGKIFEVADSQAIALKKADAFLTPRLEVIKEAVEANMDCTYTIQTLLLEAGIDGRDLRKAGIKLGAVTTLLLKSSIIFVNPDVITGNAFMGVPASI
jgi:hypothetical protein